MRLLITLLAVAAGLTACHGGAREPGDPIRVAYAGPTDFDDLPSLIAHNRLREAGQAVEEVAFSLSEQSAEAVARGDVAFANGSLRTFWAARSRGADVVTIMTHVGNVHRLIARATVTGCDHLVGRQIGIHSEGAAGTALLRAWLDEECRGLEIRTLAIPRSENRAAALLSGGLDVAVVELSLFTWLTAQAPGEFHVLGDFHARWPELETTGVHVHGTLLRTQPALVEAYLRARLEADRAVVAEPARLVEEAARAIGPSADWMRIMRAYVDAGIWSGDGGLTSAAARRSLRFLQESGSLDPALTIDDVVDLRILDRLRISIGGEPGTSR